jgi:lipoprotein signal peptidase
MRWDWRPMMWVIAILSMVIGSLLAVTQTDMKRMLAFSSVAHTGFILLGVISTRAAGLSSNLYYLLAYCFTSVGVFAIVAVVFLLRAVRKATTQFSALALCAIVAGAIGNIADRIFREEGLLHGRVVDFIDLQWFPVFNVADSSITVGACALIAAMLMEARSGKGVDNTHES